LGGAVGEGGIGEVLEEVIAGDAVEVDAIAAAAGGELGVGRDGDGEDGGEVGGDGLPGDGGFGGGAGGGALIDPEGEQSELGGGEIDGVDLVVLGRHPGFGLVGGDAEQQGFGGFAGDDGGA
jgi:hypothetical protein